MMIQSNQGEKIMSRVTSQIYNSAAGIGLGHQNDNSMVSVDVRRHSSPSYNAAGGYKRPQLSSQERATSQSEISYSVHDNHFMKNLSNQGLQDVMYEPSMNNQKNIVYSDYAQEPRHETEISMRDEKELFDYQDPDKVKYFSNLTNSRSASGLEVPKR